MVFNIHIHTQYMENYGFAEGAEYWKFKGGDTFVVTGFKAPLNDGLYAAGLAVVESLRTKLEYDNEACRQYILDWEFQPEGTLTQWEQDQLEFDGRVDSQSPRVAL